MFKSLFINTTAASNWIFRIIAEDICREVKKLGLTCRMGKLDQYQGEDIVYHMWWRLAVPVKGAKLNSVFITHTDDALKEFDLKKMKNSFDSFVCMSPEDAKFLCDLGFDSSKVVGLDLPARNNYIRPMSIGIFSACYPDGRKNEQWLLDYCENDENAKLLNFVFIGSGWYRIAQRLEEMSISFEWHNVPRELPYEYQFQQDVLKNVDYYMYMGMDGGAMGTLDAYAMGCQLIITNDGFHQTIPNIDYAFDTRDGFIKQMMTVAKRQRDKIDFYKKRTVENYVIELVKVWNGEYSVQNDFKKKIDSSYSNVLEKRRKNYFKLNFNRIMPSVKSWLRRELIKRH
jgi:hypothetical protein